ncbi:MAG: tyrosine-type recombinase/integrase [Dehalococcoidia bacterium]|nr:tyrosine-type recombinase/integrase [Dehalococcoidia bacterium]
MVRNQLIGQRNYAQQRITRNQLISPLKRIIGDVDLWGRMDAFLNISDANGYSPNTISSYRNLLTHFIRFMNSQGVTYPDEVMEQHIVAYIIHRKRTCNGVSVGTYFRHVRAWFNWMRDPHRGIIQTSPFDGLKTPPTPKTVIKPLTGDQVQRIMSFCTDYFRGARDKALVMLIYDSGLRRSELSNIKLEDIDLKRGAIKIMGKGARERYIAIGDVTKKVLLSYLYRRTDNLPWLFVTQKVENRAQMSPGNISQIISDLMRCAGITGVKLGPHTLRHSFATASIRNGANLFHVQSLLGHSTLDMTRRYAATVDSEEAVRQHHKFSPADRLKR